MNNPYSPHVPGLQIHLDATSIGEWLFCPRKYMYTMIQGWQGDSIDLEFGKFFATAMEHYHKMRADGASKDDAQLAVVKEMMISTYGWGGEYREVWRCEGVEPYKNSKGNRAVCPYAHKGVWFPEPAPPICGECGSPISEERVFFPDHKEKNRHTLLRAITWYVEWLPEDMENSLHPYVFPDGTKAIELSYRVPLPWQSPGSALQTHLDLHTGPQYTIGGHMDFVGILGNELFIVDNKTTTKPLSAAFWGGYSPHYQMDTYDMIGSTLFKDLNIRGIMVEGIQVTQQGARFSRRPFYKTEDQREEHLQMIRDVIEGMERAASTGHYPMNKRSCWLCPFKTICERDPADREHALRHDDRFHQGIPWPVRMMEDR